MCPMSCHPTLCGMRVTVDGERLVRVEGDPDHPDSKGFLCLRGRAAQEIIGSPERLLHPLARPERGSSQWERISWSEALARISAKLRAIEPHELALWQGHGDAATNYGTRIGGMLARRFAHLYGCQWWHPAMICWGLGGFGLGLTGVLEVHTKEDVAAHADLVILWGANLASQPDTAPHLVAARRRGARVVVIDVRDTEATAQADQMLRIRPGTDAALALAMMHVIVARDLVDTEYVAAHTVGFDALKPHLAAHDPEWAAAHTGISADAIEGLALDYARTRRATILVGGSSMNKSANGWQAPRAIACLPALTGKLGVPGGGLGPRHGGWAHGQGLNAVLPERPPACKRPVPTQMSAMLDAFEAGRIKALLLTGTDMVSSFADAGRLARGLERVELIVCHDLFPNETIRQHADLVLPATAWLEQLGAKMTYTHLYLMEQALPAPGETLTLSAILRALAGELGVGDFFPWESDAGLIDAIIGHPSTGHATVAALRAEAGRRALRVSPQGHPDHRFPTPSGKVELYSQRAADLGLPALPVYEPVADDPEHPLRFRQGRTLAHFHGFYDHGQALPTLRQRGGRPELWIAPDDAAPRGIEDGAPIRIYNARGSFTAHACVTGRIERGTVWMRDGWVGSNRLTAGSAALPDSASDLFPFSVGQAAFDAAVEVEPA